MPLTAGQMFDQHLTAGQMCRGPPGERAVDQWQKWASRSNFARTGVLFDHWPKRCKWLTAGQKGRWGRAAHAAQGREARICRPLVKQETGAGQIAVQTGSGQIGGQTGAGQIGGQTGAGQIGGQTGAGRPLDKQAAV